MIIGLCIIVAVLIMVYPEVMGHVMVWTAGGCAVIVVICAVAIMN